MPTATANGRELHYDTDGEGECVAFIGDCGFGAWQWAWQYDGLAGPYRTLIWDLPGTGRSDPPDGSLTVTALASDLEAVLADGSVRRVHLVGAGLGGMVALEYAREYSRAATLTLVGTAAAGEAVALDPLRALYPEEPTRETLERSLSGAFTPAFRDAAREVVERICDWRLEEDADAASRERQRQAMTAFEAGHLYEITEPALVLHGIEDPVISSERGEALASSLPRGEFEAVEGKRLAHVESGRAVADRIDGFLNVHTKEE